MDNHSAYGLWTLVIINSVVFIFFVFSFVKPKTGTDWRSLGLVLLSAARREEQAALHQFGPEYRAYMQVTPFLFPKIKVSQNPTPTRRTP